MVVWAAALVVATVTLFRSFRVPGGRCHLLSRVYRFGGCGSASGAHVSFFSLCLPPFYDCLLSLGDKLTVRSRVRRSGFGPLQQRRLGGEAGKKQNEAPCLQKVSVYHDAFLHRRHTQFFLFFVFHH